MSITDKSGEILWSQEWNSSYSLPEKTRINIRTAARQKVESNPRCIEDNIARNQEEAEKAVEQFIPKEPAVPNNSSKDKVAGADDGVEAILQRIMGIHNNAK